MWKKRKLVYLALVMALVLPVFIATDYAQAGDPPRTYFRFDIPLGCRYSPGWCGVMDRVPKDPVVVLYNDKAGYGIAYTTDTFFPKEATLVTKEASDSTLASAKEEAGTYYGSKLDDRWLPEVRIEEFKVTVDEKGTASIFTSEKSEDFYRGVVVKKGIVCPKCGAFLEWYMLDTLSIRIIHVCPFGHRSVTATYESLESK